MSELVKYKLSFPQFQLRTSSDTLTFSIGKIKSRTPVVVYFKFYGYDLHNTLITEYMGDRWVITSEYTKKYKTFNLTMEGEYTVDDLDTCKIELYTIGVTSEIPIWFNRLQLNIGEDKDYHKPNDEIQNVNIGFHRNSYVNLYDTTEKFLQIIRPNHESFTTETLSPSQYTILAPHLPYESEFDSPVALLYEYMYQTEQVIGVEK